MRRRFSIGLLCAVMLIMLAAPPVSAAEFRDETVVFRTVTTLEEGYYIVTEIREAIPSTLGRAAQTKTGSKTKTLYSNADTKIGSLTVSGTFTYNGSTASATSASYSHSISNALWSFSGGSASRSGATATAKGNFIYVGQSQTLTVSLTCSPNGTLS